MDQSIVERHLGKEQYLGDKIDIIGSFGAGKTTLALQLGEILEIPVFHLDRYFWLPGWKEKPEDVRIKILEGFVQQKQWVIEGAYLRISEPRLNEADSIIFLDISTWPCLKHTFYRRFLDRRPRPDLPAGCPSNLNPWRIGKVLFFRIRHHKELSQKIHKYESSKKVIWLHSPEEVESFLSKLRQEVNDKKDTHTSEPVGTV
jgi:adenylate kinase family enzyme